MEFLLGTGGVIADFKRDGNADLAACGFGQLCKLFFGDGAGNVSKGTDLDLNVAYGPGSLATADLNGHDNLDIVVSNFDLVFGQGNGTFSTAVNYGGSIQNCWANNVGNKIAWNQNSRH